MTLWISAWLSCLYSADFISTPPTAPPWKWMSPCCRSRSLMRSAWFWHTVKDTKKPLFTLYDIMKCLKTRSICISSGSIGDADSALSPDVYVSDDGGYSWRLALRGPHHYAILDSGGLLVAMEHTNSPVNQIKWIYLSIPDNFFAVARYLSAFSNHLPASRGFLCRPLLKVFNRWGAVLAYV